MQEKEYKTFKEQQKQEMRLLKQELDLMSKDNRKDSVRKRKDLKEIELADKVCIIMELADKVCIIMECFNEIELADKVCIIMEC